MTRDEALKFIEIYKNWNVGQTSVSYAFSGKRTPEDDIFDERRRTLLEAYRILREKAEEGGGRK